MKKTINIIRISLLAILFISSIVSVILMRNIISSSMLMVLSLGLILVIALFTYIYFIQRKGEKKLISLLYTIFISIVDVIVITFTVIVMAFDNKMSDFYDSESYYKGAIVALKNNNYTLNDLKNKKIGFSSNTNDYENNILPKEILGDTKYDEYQYLFMNLGIADLINGNIDALGISYNFDTIYDEYFEEIDLSEILEVIDTKTLKKENDLINIPIDENKPFTILFIGADRAGNSYNADTLVLTTINPITKKVVMVDVVRDTYVLNKCNDMMDKITHIGWYSDMKCKLDTVGGLFDIKIDYYVKTNFEGLVNLIDLNNGIKFNVPYDVPVKSSGKTYTLKKGMQTISGTEALALARARKIKNTSLFSRGRMQMQIIEELFKQVNMDFVANNFFDVFSTISASVKTNISKEDVYLFAQKFAFENNYEFSKNTLKGSNSSYYHNGMKMNLYTYKPNQKNLNDLSSKLNKNLEY